MNKIYLILLGLTMFSCSYSQNKMETKATEDLHATITAMIDTLESKDADYEAFMNEYVDPMLIMQYKGMNSLADIAENFGKSDSKEELLRFLKLARRLEPTYLDKHQSKAVFTHTSMTNPMEFINIDGNWYLRN